MSRSRSLFALALCCVAACRGTSPLEDLARAESAAADLRLQVEKTDKASAQAVMADTDEASRAFAQAAERARGNATREKAELAALLQSLRLDQDLQALSSFGASWEKYQASQARILALAVENTNLKAQSLAFGPVREAADAFRDAILGGAASLSGGEACRAAARAQSALVAIREEQVLLEPHIAEPEDAKMTQIEQEITEREGRAQAELHALEALGPSPQWAAASVALERLHALAAQAVALSRRNTNVRSLALSLHEQITLAAACDEDLARLQKDLAGESSRATR